MAAERTHRERRARIAPQVVEVLGRFEAVGESPADHALEEMSAAPISLSKYRVGMSLVGGAERFGSQPGADLFS